jgi:hypothetical protein
MRPLPLDAAAAVSDLRYALSLCPACQHSRMDHRIRRHRINGRYLRCQHDGCKCRRKV